MTAPIGEFAREVLGLPLFPKQEEILSEIYRDDIRTAVLRLGRRSGKGRMAAVVAVYEATVNEAAHLANVVGGEDLDIVIVAKSQQQAGKVHGFVRSFLQVPALAGRVKRELKDAIELKNGITIMTVPSDAGSARGGAVPVAIFDEAAWFAGRDGSPLDPKEMWAALSPATAQFEQGRIIVMSTPRWSTGWFADLVGQASSGEFDDMRAWHATTEEMNPLIRPAWLERERAKDPAFFRREYEAEFDSGIGAVFDDALVRAAIRDGELMPEVGNGYLMALDPAYTGDTFAVLIGHLDGVRIVVDRVRGWAGTRANPVSIDQALDEIALLSQAYGGAPAITDQGSAQPILQGLRQRGVFVEEQPWTNESKVNAVAAVRRALYGGRLSIPRHRELITELVTLEQRPLPSGRPRIAAPGRAHDDYATALMALVASLDAPEDQEEVVYWDQRTGEYVNDPALLTRPDPYSLYTRPRIPELAEDDEGWTRVPHGDQW